MLVSNAVKTVRSLVHGTQFSQSSALAEPYVAGSQSLKLQYAKPALRPGTIMSVGLNTLQVMASNSAGDSFEVMASADGGPDVDCAQGEQVLISPPFSTWACVREMQSAIDGISSVASGLYMPWIIESEYVDRVSGMYAIPTLEEGGSDLVPIRLLRAEYQQYGRTAWTAFTDAQYQPEQRAIRVFSDPAGVAWYRFTLAMPFGTIENLTDDLDTLGITAGLVDAVTYGAASVLVLGLEGRRTQPVAAGDSRRSTEVAVGSNAGLSRQWRALQQQVIADESARLLRLYGYRQSVAAPGGVSARARLR